ADWSHLSRRRRPCPPRARREADRDTGTLDPMASGVLPLVVGRATRLMRYLSGDKAYDATIRLGQNTDSYDAMGEPVGPRHDGPWPARATVDAALERFRGTFLQQPPAFSAEEDCRTTELRARASRADLEPQRASARSTLTSRRRPFGVLCPSRSQSRHTPSI
ncbi:MAG: hypothetical protein QM736_26885, partial [Vicinamibacterales bacterium]